MRRDRSDDAAGVYDHGDEHDDEHEYDDEHDTVVALDRNVVEAYKLTWATIGRRRDRVVGIFAQTRDRAATGSTLAACE